MSTPTSACLLTTSSTPRCIATSNAAWSYGSPRSWVNRKSTTSCDRGRLPTCDVRIRSVLVFILISRVSRRWSLVLGLWARGFEFVATRSDRPETGDPRPGTRSDSLQLRTNHPRAVHHCLQLPERHVTREIFQPAVRRDDDALRIHVC